MKLRAKALAVAGFYAYVLTVAKIKVALGFVGAVYIGRDYVFFTVSKQIQSSHRFNAAGNDSGSLVLEVGRTHMRGILFSVYSSKAFVEFRDEATGKAVPKRKWTEEMKTAAASHIASAAKPPHVFKLTIIGWICAALVVAVFASLIYDSVKGPEPMPAAYTALAAKPEVGDRYFGSYETYKNKDGKMVHSGTGFCWFKVVGVEGDQYVMARSTEVSPHSRPQEELNSESFADESLKMKITEQQGYAMRMQADDGSIKVDFSAKK